MRRLMVCSVAVCTIAATACPASAATPAHRPHNAHKAVAAKSSAASKAAALTPSSLPDFGAIMGLMDKIFPPGPDPDPARLALARTTAQSMWPNGAYANALVSLFGGAFDRAMLLKLADLGALAGAKAKDSPVAKDVSLHDAALEKDPYFDQRVAAIRAAVDEELAKVSAVLDPRVRDGLARALARRFDAQQLRDLNIFFATPTGQKLAGGYMQLWVDPDMIRALFGTMPEMMKLMPEAMQKIKAAEEKYPKPAKAADTEKASEPQAKSDKP